MCIMNIQSNLNINYPSCLLKRRGRLKENCGKLKQLILHLSFKNNFNYPLFVSNYHKRNFTTWDYDVVIQIDVDS